MKVIIAYPPLESEKGVPLLSQNRQFQWFHNPTYIYPMIPAMAATLLQQAGFEVIWADGIAERWTYQNFLKKVLAEKPDLIAIETKTPVVKKHWKIIEELKILSGNGWSLKTVLMGDHVTALPEESMHHSKVDYVLTGGDFDLLLLNLCQHLIGKEKLQPGIWYRKESKVKSRAAGKAFGDARQKLKVKNTGKFQLNHDLNKLPFIDRDLTKWQLYAYDNGNYKKTPGTYTMAGRDCWWAKCTFCSWTTIFPRFRVRTPENLLDEIGFLIKQYNVQEIMDDTGTFPVGGWLEKFCQGMIERGYHNKINLDCNMRFGVLNQKQYDLMGKAGFRFILYGLESANQKTLDRLNKGTKVGEIARDCRMAKQAGLMPHLTVMVGYPWETKTEAQKTLDLAKRLFEQGWADSLQATVVIPYPGTPLFAECQKNGWLETENWDEYDMTKPVMKTSMKPEKIMQLSQSLYGLAFRPKFLFRQFASARNINDFKYLVKAGRAVIGHLADFSRS